MKRKILILITAGLLTIGGLKAQAFEDLSSKKKTELTNFDNIAKNGSPEQVEEAFKKIISEKVNKKDPLFLYSLGQVFLVREHDVVNAGKCLALIAKADKKSPYFYLLQGDIAAFNNDGGAATSAYNQAIYFNPDCVEAYIHLSMSYSKVNPTQSIEVLEQLKARGGENVIKAEEAIASAYYRMNNFEKANESYRILLANPTYKPTDNDYAQYALSLLVSGKNQEAADIASKAIKQSPNSPTFQRMYFYALTALKNFDQAEIAAKTYFANPKAKFGTMDYNYLIILERARKDYQAVNAAIDKAMALDSTTTGKLAFMKEKADNLTNMGDPLAGAKMFQQFLSTQPDSLNNFQNNMELGIMFYNAGSLPDSSSKYTPEQKESALHSALAIFTKCTTLNPTSKLAVLFQGRSASALDPDAKEGLALPFYQKLISQITLDQAQDNEKSRLVEAYRYLGYYHYQHNDIDKAKENWEKILAIDPDNTVVKQILDTISGKGTKKRGKGK